MCKWLARLYLLQYVGNMTHSRLRTVCCFGKFAMRVFPRNKREIHWVRSGSWLCRNAATLAAVDLSTQKSTIEGTARHPGAKPCNRRAVQGDCRASHGRYCSRSRHSIAAQYRLIWAKDDRLHCGKTASLFAITNSGYSLCRWQAIAKSRQIIEQRLSLLQVDRIKAFSEPTVHRS